MSHWQVTDSSVGGDPREPGYLDSWGNILQHYCTASEAHSPSCSGKRVMCLWPLDRGVLWPYWQSQRQSRRYESRWASESDSADQRTQKPKSQVGGTKKETGTFYESPWESEMEGTKYIRSSELRWGCKERNGLNALVRGTVLPLCLFGPALHDPVHTCP